MKRSFWTLLVCAATLPLLAADDLVLTGGKSTYQTNSYDTTLKSLVPYIIPVCFLAGGLTNLFYPRFGWWLKWGWQFKDAPEPSTLWLLGERLGGLVLIGIAIAMFYGFKFVKHS